MKPSLLLLLAASFAHAQIDGIVDLHVHSAPDIIPRKMDAVELTRMALNEGFRAIVLKNHYTSTVSIANVVSAAVPGFPVYGGIVLNQSNGGINPAAVEQAAAMLGGRMKIVWMPTNDRETIAIARNGQLLPETVAVLKIIAKYDLTLATGHLKPADGLLLLKEAKALGVKRMIVTHPFIESVAMTIDQMKQATALGAYLEFSANQVMPTAVTAKMAFSEYPPAIRAVGVEHVILSGDFGQVYLPTLAEGWKLYRQMLKSAGFTDAEFDIMARKNPAKLIGLD